jgi:hypothetical protein
LDTFAKEFVAVPMVADGRIFRAIWPGDTLVRATFPRPFLASQWHHSGADWKGPERINDDAVHRR